MIEYRSSAAGITPDQLTGPFFVGWPDPPSPEKHLEVLAGSDHIVLAIHEPDQRVVGFVTAITDGVLFAYISMLEVVADYQDRGIGSELVRRLLAEIGDIYAVDAMVDAELQPFYRHLGLVPGVGVMLRNYTRQSGR